MYGNHDNHSTIKCLFDNYWKSETKKHPIPNASWDYNFQFQKFQILWADKPILANFENKLNMEVGVPDFGEGQVEK